MTQLGSYFPPFGIIKFGPQRGDFQVSSTSESLDTVFEVYGGFSIWDLTFTSVEHLKTEAIMDNV